LVDEQAVNQSMHRVKFRKGTGECMSEFYEFDLLSNLMVYF